LKKEEEEEKERSGKFNEGPLDSSRPKHGQDEDAPTLYSLSRYLYIIYEIIL